MPQPPDQRRHLATIAHTVLSDVYHLGDALNDIDLSTLAERIQRIHRGLNAQKEFHAITKWLGKTIAIHEIDDPGTDKPERPHRAPDYLLVADNNGTPLPLLVEVKKSNNPKLEWAAGYLSSLQRFATMLNVPLLVAWKHYDRWVLVDTIHFAKRQTAYHLTFATAYRENLMTEVCGDIMVIPDEECKLIIEAAIHDPLPPVDQLVPEGTYRTTITNASIHTRHGKLTDASDGMLWLLYTASLEHTVERIEQQVLKTSFRPEPEHMFPLSRILFTQLAAQHDDAETIDWNAVLHHAPITPSGKHYRDHLQNALDLGVLANVMEFLPHSRPVYLPPGEEGMVRVRAPRSTRGQQHEPGNESGQGLRPPR